MNLRSTLSFYVELVAQGIVYEAVYHLILPSAVRVCRIIVARASPTER